MSADAVIKKYSQALFEATEESNKTGVVAFELDLVTKIFAQEDCVSFFVSPYNSLDTKIMVAKSALEGRCSAEAFNFVITLVDKERVAFLAQINDAYQALVRTKGGETDGTLFVPAAVSDEFRAQVEQKLSHKLNKKVKLKVAIDGALISGYRASVGGWTIDDSAQFHLNKIKENISKRNN